MLFLVASLLGSCATAVRSVELPLPDPAALPASDPEARGPEIRLLVGKVEDVRRFPRLIEHRDKQGKVRWRAVSAAPVEDWLADSAAVLLGAGGFRIAEDRSDADLVLDLRLREALVTTRGDKRKAKVLLNAWVRCAHDRRVLGLCVLKGQAKEPRDGTSDGGVLADALAHAFGRLLDRIETCPRCADAAGGHRADTSRDAGP